MVPLALTVGTYAGTWWYVVIHSAPAAAQRNCRKRHREFHRRRLRQHQSDKAQELGGADEKPQELGSVESKTTGTRLRRKPRSSQANRRAPADAPPQEMGSLAEPAAAASGGKVPAQFYTWFWAFAALSTLLLAYYYRRMDGEQFRILKELAISVVPLGVLTIVVLAVILLGICTATESAAIGALGALYLAVMVKFPRSCGWWSLLGAVIGVALGFQRGDIATLIVSGSLGAMFVGTGIPLMHRTAEITRAPAQSSGSDFSHRQDHGDGVLAVHRLGAVFRRLRFARRPRIDRTLGARHESFAAGLSACRPGDHFSARLAAGVDRDHRHFLSDLYSAARVISTSIRSCSAPWWRSICRRRSYRRRWRCRRFISKAWRPSMSRSTKSSPA